MKRFILPILAFTAFALAPRSEAADGTWTFAGNGTWDLATNWSGSTIANGANSTATFSYGLPNTTSSIISVDTARTIGNLTFTGTASAGTHNITLNGPEALTLSTGTATAPAIAANMASRIVTINTVLKGSEGLTLSSTGTGLILGGANTYTGLTQISNGFITVNNNLAFGSTTGETTITTTAAGITLNNGITVTGETVNVRGAGSGSNYGVINTSSNAIAEWAGNIRLDGSSRFGSSGASSVLTLSGVISDGTTSGVTLAFGYGGTSDVNGTVVLSGSNTYTGATSIVRGTVKLDGGNNRLPTTTAVTMGGSINNATLDINGTNQQILSLANGASTSTRTVTNNSATASILTFNGSADASFLGGGISGNLSLVKNGTYSQTLGTTNSYTGNTTINTGTLVLAGGSTMTSTGNITVNSTGTLNFSDNATMTFFIKGNGVNNGISGSGGITLDGDFIFDLSGASPVANDSWNIISVGTATFGTTFQVQGFTKSGNVWTKIDNNNMRFYEATGILSVVPEPSTAALLLLGGASGLYVARRRRKI